MAGDVEQGARDGLSRRQMIKASAVAGAAAWTAPVIIDSLSSPAAAGSLPCKPGTPNLSYGMIIYKVSSTYYVLKIAGNSCTQDNQTSGDITGDVNFTCGGVTFTNPSGTILANGVATSVGTCANITIHNSGGNVTANNGITIIAAFAHDGSLPNHVGCFFCSTNPNCASICENGT